jgi:hypothetical protein
MTHRRKSLRALGLSFLAALGLMAFMAAGAQAANGWLVLSANNNLAKDENVSVVKHTEGNLLVPNQNLEILCSTVASDGLELIAGTFEARGAINFTNCKTFQNGTISNVCKPQEPILAGGKAHIFLDNGVNYMLLEPTTGLSGVFAHITFGGLCALPKLNEVTGTLVVECLNGSLKSDNCSILRVAQLLQAAPNQGLFAIKLAGEEHVHGLFLGANPATLDGIASVKLAGPNETGQSWSGHF